MFAVCLTPIPEEVLDAKDDPDPEAEVDVAGIVVSVMAAVMLPVAAGPLPVAVEIAEWTRVAPGTALVPVPIS